MGWDRGYYYRSLRTGRGPRRQYVGKGPVADLAAEMDAIVRDRRETEAAVRRAERREVEALDRPRVLGGACRPSDGPAIIPNRRPLHAPAPGPAGGPGGADPAAGVGSGPVRRGLWAGRRDPPGRGCRPRPAAVRAGRTLVFLGRRLSSRQLGLPTNRTVRDAGTPGSWQTLASVALPATTPPPPLSRLTRHRRQGSTAMQPQRAAEILRRRRPARLRHPRPPLTLAQILAWADAP